MCITGHPGGFLPHHDGTEEAPVGGYVQSQLSGDGWGQAGDGQCSQSAAGGEADLRGSPGPLPHIQWMYHCAGLGASMLGGVYDTPETGLSTRENIDLEASAVEGLSGVR